MIKQETLENKSYTPNESNIKIDECDFSQLHIHNTIGKLDILGIEFELIYKKFDDQSQMGLALTKEAKIYIDSDMNKQNNLMSVKIHNLILELVEKKHMKNIEYIDEFFYTIYDKEKEKWKK